MRGASRAAARADRRSPQLGEDEKRLGAQLGLTAVLHTWTRELRFHPHLHCIVTGGGLTRDGVRWKASKQDYLFPVTVLSALFRGKGHAQANPGTRTPATPPMTR